MEKNMDFRPNRFHKKIHVGPIIKIMVYFDDKFCDVPQVFVRKILLAVIA